MSVTSVSKAMNEIEGNKMVKRNDKGFFWDGLFTYNELYDLKREMHMNGICNCFDTKNGIN